MKENDTVIFITKKGSYLNVKSHWRLCAILKVKIVFENRLKASEWYKKNNEMIPSNCMVQGNIPNDLDRTIGARKHESLEKWDLGYKIRSRKWPVFVVTNTIFKELDSPPIITEEDMISIFKRIPATRNPPQIKKSEYENVLKMTN